MSIAALASRQVEICSNTALQWRNEARQDRMRADEALARGDREAHDRWSRLAAQCDGWAAESEEAEQQFRAILQRAEELA